MFSEERSSTHYITMWNKGVQQHHCGVLPLLHGVPVSRRARLSEKARSEPTLPPSKLWRLRKPLPALFAWGPAQEGQKTLSGNTACRFPPCRYRSCSTRKPADALPFAACNLLSPHNQSVLVPGREIPLLHLLFGARRQHNASALMDNMLPAWAGSTLATSDPFVTKLER